MDKGVKQLEVPSLLEVSKYMMNLHKEKSIYEPVGNLAGGSKKLVLFIVL